MQFVGEADRHRTAVAAGLRGAGFNTGAAVATGSGDDPPGICITDLQVGQRPFLPAIASGVVTVLLHAAQTNLIGMRNSVQSCGETT